MQISVKAVKLAINQFNKGERPFKYTEARSWYVVGEDEHLYPLKYIYALITNKPTNEFNTSEPIAIFSRLGVELLHLPKNRNEDFLNQVKSSLKNDKERKSRLKKSDKIPKTRATTVIEFIRNPDVVAEVLKRANGVCECCHDDAPFKRKDGTPFLEVHHKIFLSKGGEDSVENAEALCPNCHREKHYG